MAGARRYAVLLLAVLALALSGFAHRAAPVNHGQPSLAELQLPDGTQLSICITGENSHHGEDDGHCDFCRIATGSHAIDGAPDLAPFDTAGLISHPLQSRETGGIRWRAHSARAPPALA